MSFREQKGFSLGPSITVLLTPPGANPARAERGFLVNGWMNGHIPGHPVRELKCHLADPECYSVGPATPHYEGRLGPP